jgi:hypothetical protein
MYDGKISMKTRRMAQWGLTEASVMGQLLVDLLHPLYVQPAGLGVVDHGFGVVHAHHAVGGLLDG